ncbi:histidine kinase [Cupriavidus sp. YR651]|uniref:sensor histidine kinase n=1 Tax=Cupriavidus sp. YR651 TaxID=1855315 RepID=UPI00088939E1|nr:ATP-binding protein [Cupriavidus sp. YR651]SDD75890.1 histidine kinase [Cupriavidus sp. YR651]
MTLPIRLAVATAFGLAACKIGGLFAGWQAGRGRTTSGTSGTGKSPGSLAASDPDYRRLVDLSRVSSMGELAGSLAHELNQPLTAITSNAQAALKYLDTDPANVAEVREILADVASDACRASALVRQIRALIRGEATQFAPVDLNAVIDDVMTLVRGDALSRDIVVMRRMAPSLPRVIGDPVQIQQVLLNLLLNAFDAIDARNTSDARGPGAGCAREVSVLAAEADGMVQVSVCDTGCGVASGELDNMFVPFVTSKPHGMGLGLSISRSIVERHGGYLQARNNEEGGMTFRFSLPPEAVLPDRGAGRTAAMGAAMHRSFSEGGRNERNNAEDLYR